MQARDKGSDNLYGGKSVVEKAVRNPFTTQDWGKEPLSYVYGINTKIERFLEYNRQAFLMALKENALGELLAQ